MCYKLMLLLSDVYKNCIEIRHVINKSEVIVEMYILNDHRKVYIREVYLYRFRIWFFFIIIIIIINTDNY